MTRLRVAAVVLVAFLAVVAGDASGGVATSTGSDETSPGLTTGVGALGELLVPSRPSAAAAGWLEPGSAKTRLLAQAAVVALAVALLLLGVSALVRRRPGPPWHHLRRHSAVLRAPPLLPRP